MSVRRSSICATLYVCALSLCIQSTPETIQGNALAFCSGEVSLLATWALLKHAAVSRATAQPPHEKYYDSIQYSPWLEV